MPAFFISFATVFRDTFTPRDSSWAQIRGLP
jgi:hypothetical protein